jgi:hypothetical protein
MSMRKRQQAQYEHDLHNHFDILSLSRLDRLKHYGLHFAKYAGRLARGEREAKSRQETLVDAFLVALSAANALASSSHQWPMSMNEQRPMISQPRISWTMFSARTIASMPALNSVSAAKKWVKRRSPRTYSIE